MKIRIVKASDVDTEIIKEGQTAQDILNLIKEYGHSIIVEKTVDDCYHCDYDITIYDSWIE